MPRQTELNARQLAFVEYYSQGNMSLAEAYKRAGYKAKNENTASSAAWKLLQKDEIKKAVRFAESERAKRAKVDGDWLVKGLKRTITRAEEDGAHGAAVAGYKELGVLTGHRVEKREETVTTMTHEERIEMMRKRREEQSE